MRKRILFTMLITLMLFGAMVPSAWAGPPPPPSDSPYPCYYQGHRYENDQSLMIPTYTVNGILLFVDIFRCTNGDWLYLKSQSPGEAQPGQPDLVFPDLTCEITVETGLPNNQLRFDYTVLNQSNEAVPAVAIQRKVISWHNGFSAVMFNALSMTDPFLANETQTFSSPNIGPTDTDYYEATMTVNVDQQIIEMNIGNNTCSLETEDPR